MKKKRLLSLLLTGALCLSLSAPALAAGLENFQKTNTYTAGQFTDVPAGEWYAANVQAAYELGLMEGSSASTFNPSGNLTIAEALVLACRLHSTYVGDGATFTGSGGAWYQPYVDYAVETAILSPGTYSDYTATATRAQFASILAAALPAEALTAINSVTALPDVAADAAYAPAALSLYNAGVLTGSDAAGSFKPDTTIQRSEVATIVTRMADPSLRKTFTLTSAETTQPADDGQITLDDLQGVWYGISYYESGKMRSEEEFIIEGDQFTRTYHSFFDNSENFSQIKGTIKDVATDYTTGNPPHTYPLSIIFESATITTNGDGPFVTKDHEMPFNFLAYDLNSGYLKPNADNLCYKADAPKLLYDYQSAFTTKVPTAEDFGYQGYADFPSIPDFGALYGLELQPDPTEGDLSPQLEAFKDLIDQYTQNQTTYYYSAWEYQEEHDTLVPPALDINFFDDYAEALEACGFEGVYRRNVVGDLTFYFEGNGYLVSYGINSVADVLGYTGINANKNDDIVIYIQPA